jgi:uncharacterized membrane protein YbhN (UPF0104 family)
MVGGEPTAGEPPRLDPAPPRAWLRVARWAMVAAVLIGAIWFFRGFDFSALIAALGRASLALIAAAALANLTLNTAARVERFRVLLPPSPRRARPVGFLELAALLLASQAASNVLPLRAGEAVLTLGLHERHGYPFKTLIAAQLAEKPIAALSIMVFALPPALSAPPSSRLFQVLCALAFTGCLAIGLILWIARRSAAAERRGGGLQRLNRRIAEAFTRLGGPRALGRSLLWSTASDAIDVALIGLSMAAVGLHLSPVAWCAVLLVVNLAIVIPSSPAQLGVLEASAVLVLTGLGVGRSEALAFALVYHAVHLLPTTVAGGLALAIQRLCPDQGCHAV